MQGVPISGAALGPTGPWAQLSLKAETNWERAMLADPLSLVGAILGSTLFVYFGRPTAVRLVKLLVRSRKD
jgi:hypothetical protein